MVVPNKFLVVDAGNTKIKIALFEKNEIIKVLSVPSENLTQFKSIIKSLQYSKSILSSVQSEKNTNYLKSTLKNCLDFKNLIYPINILYQSKETLGTDRIANAVAAKFKNKLPALIIDVGTCIKFDFINKVGSYEGGSISPGIHLRYKSLNDYTGKLPLLNKSSYFNKIPFLGRNTSECIQSGVIKGIQGEINYFIDFYSQTNPGLTIFVTGGDYLYFDYSSKNNIFADENLTLFGLLHILKANAQ